MAREKQFLPGLSRFTRAADGMPDPARRGPGRSRRRCSPPWEARGARSAAAGRRRAAAGGARSAWLRDDRARSAARPCLRSEEHTSELQSLMRISYAVVCLKKKNYTI